MVGLAKSKVSPGAAIAFWIGNPVLNPATIIFMGFVLGWNWAVLRIFVGIALVAAAAWIATRSDTGASVPEAAHTAVATAVATRDDNAFVAWLKAIFALAVGLIPEYIVIVLILGATRAWLFPTITPAIGGSLLLFIGLAVAGTLFVIPTAGEVPIVQSLLSAGLGSGGAGALMITLPALSLPSIAMVARGLPLKLLVQVAALVFVFGIATGLLALAFGIA